MDPRKCSGCGKEIVTVGAAFCHHCGVKDPLKTSKANQAPPPAAPKKKEAVFRLFSESPEKILAECATCGRVLMIAPHQASPSAEGYLVAAGFRCPCGLSGTRISKKQGRGPSRSAGSKVRCPKCRSEQIAGGTKGFGLGKAAAGGLLVGPVGLFAGLFGSKKTTVTCLNCGHRWKAGGR